MICTVGMAPPSIHKDGMEGDAPNNQRGGDNGGGGGGGGNHGGGHYMKQENNHDSSSTKDLSPEQLQNKIFVGGLPLHLSRDGLREFFSQFGTVVDAIIMMDAAQSRSRGFGFVTFENGSGGAQTALKSQPIYIDKKYVEIKLATPKGDQQNPHGGGNKSSKYQNHATGLRNAEAASMAYQSKGEFAGLAASFGRNGWRAGYGTIAFGSSGWNVKGWEDISKAPEHSGFSFSLIENTKQRKDSSRKKRGGSMNSLENNKGVKRQRQS
jgi:RNA recognition motif-containing protein